MRQTVRAVALAALTPAALVPVTVLPPPASAQSPETGRRAPVIEVPRVDRPPPLDATLADPAWARGVVLADWVQTEPGDNVPASGRTEARFVHDDDALYVGIRVRDARGVRWAVHPRDRVTEQGQDWIGMLLDTFGDRRQAFGIALNPLGIQGDGVLREGGGFVEWDAIFQSHGRIHDDGLGFTVVARIPFRSLRFARRPVQRWGLSLSRTYGRTGAEDSPWPLDRDLGCTLCQMATLVLEGIEPGRNIEVNPGLVGRVEAARPASGAALDPYEPRLEPSLNLKYGITSNLTFDATFRPDFSQIESDAGQLEVNRRFALFFPEKRPFFLEGADIFQTAITPPGASPFVFPPLTLIHSRTIVEPDWGTKLTGKAGPIGLGAIVTRDAAAPLDLDDAAPGADVVVGRTTVDVLADGYVGGVVSGRRHAGDLDLLAGVDARLRVTSNLVLQGLYAASRYPSGAGDGPAGAPATQAFQAQADWQSRHWVGGVALVDVMPDFHAPLGFVPRTDQVTGTGSIAYVWRGTGLVQRLQPQLRYERIYDHAPGGGLLRTGELVDELWEPSLAFTLARSTGGAVGLHRAFTRFDGRDFPAQNRFGFALESQALDWLHLSASTFAGDAVIFSDITEDDQARPGWTRDVTVTATFRPAPAVRADLTLQASRIWRRTDDAPRASLFADALIPRLRAEVQATRRLGFRGIGEWRRTDFQTDAGAPFERHEGLNVELLASYLIDAGSAFHFGWTEVRSADLEHGLDPAGRGGVMKATYVWRF